jgi:hypothetical protein
VKPRPRKEDSPVADDERDLTEAAELLWEQAQRQLSQQSADLDSLRTRAIAMLSVAALAAGLFGSRVPSVHSSLGAGIAAVIALGLFAICVVLAVQIVMPMKHAWRFTSPLRVLVKEVGAGSVLPMDVALTLANHAEESRKENEAKLESLHKQFSGMCVLVGLQVVAWSLAVLAF